MASLTVPLPSLTLTSSAVDTSTQSRVAVDISDATIVSGFVNGNTSAPGLIAQVAFAASSDATFVNLVQIYPLTTAAGNGLGGSTGAIPIYLTSQGFRIPDIAAMQFRVASSGVTSTGYTIVLAKQIYTN